MSLRHSSVCLCAPSRKPHFPVDVSLILAYLYTFTCFSCFDNFLLYNFLFFFGVFGLFVPLIIGELAEGGSVAVALGVSDMLQVTRETCDM